MIDNYKVNGQKKLLSNPVAAPGIGARKEHCPTFHKFFHRCPGIGSESIF
jgi:hypothetical protein